MSMEREHHIHQDEHNLILVLHLQFQERKSFITGKLQYENIAIFRDEILWNKKIDPK